MVTAMGIIEPAAHLSDAARSYLLDAEATGDTIDFSDTTAVAALRAEVDAGWIALSEQLPGTWVRRDDEVAGVRAVWYAANDDLFDVDGVIVHLHGGSYVFGTPDVASMAVPLAQRTGRPVVSLDYRLAPEHPCPAGVDDAIAACLELGRSRTITALYGESAGGGLAVATAVGLRDAGAPMPGALGLLSPWVDLTVSGDTYRTLVHVDPDLSDPNEPPLIASVYAGGDVADPRASPLFADLAGLPRTLIQVGGREILLSDSCRLDRALRTAGVDSTLDVWDGLWHVWQIWQHVPEARRAWDELAAFILEDR